MKRTKRPPLLATTNKLPRNGSDWTFNRTVILLLLALGSLGITFVVIQHLFFEKVEPPAAPKEDLTTNNEGPSELTNGVYSLGLVNDVTGHPQDLAQFAGNISIVVNVASHCGFTDVNYRGLQQLYEKYKDEGFVVLAFPCNQFGKQESDPESVIQKFTQDQYHVTFPLFSKIDVNGPGVHKVFYYLKNSLPEADKEDFDPDFDLAWNFQKFLVGRDGVPVRLFSQDFNMEEMETAIKSLLKEQPRT